MNRYQIEDLDIGHEETFKIKVTPKMMEIFAEITGDYNPLHCDEEYARKKGFQANVVYGMLTASFFSTLAGMYLPGERSLIQSVEIKFQRPVYIGDVLMISGKVNEIHINFNMIVLCVKITNQNQNKIAKGKMQIGFV